MNNWLSVCCSSSFTNRSMSPQKFTSGVDPNDMENISALSHILYTHPYLLDIISIQTPLVPLIERALACLEAFDYVALGMFYRGSPFVQLLMMRW